MNTVEEPPATTAIIQFFKRANMKINFQLLQYTFGSLTPKNTHLAPSGLNCNSLL